MYCVYLLLLCFKRNLYTRVSIKHLVVRATGNRCRTERRGRSRRVENDLAHHSVPEIGHTHTKKKCDIWRYCASGRPGVFADNNNYYNNDIRYKTISFHTAVERSAVKRRFKGRAAGPSRELWNRNVNHNSGCLHPGGSTFRNFEIDIVPTCFSRWYRARIRMRLNVFVK